MTEESLKKLKIAINNEKKWLELKKRNLMEAKALEQNEYVRRYLELCGILTATDSIKIDDDKNVDMRIFDSFLKSINRDETNKIFIYAGTYMYDNSGMIRVKANSINAEYRKYLDIEQADACFIPIEDCEKFEKENTIIIASIDSVRNCFLKTILESDQKEAVSLIKTKYKTKKSIF